MANPTQTNVGTKMVWLDADVALRTYEESITQREYHEDATRGWTARMNQVNEAIEIANMGRRQRRDARLARQMARKAVEEEIEMGA